MCPSGECLQSPQQITSCQLLSSNARLCLYETIDQAPAFGSRYVFGFHGVHWIVLRSLRSLVPRGAVALDEIKAISRYSAQ